MLLHRFGGFAHCLFDAGRVNAPVVHQIGKGQLRDLHADRVEADRRTVLGGVVDDEGDAGGALEGADVAPLFSMMRPFNSSFGIVTEVTVVSDTQGVARRLMAVEMSAPHDDRPLLPPL